MLVSHRYRFIYTKTFKTASTSVEAYFERFCMPEEAWQPSHRRDEFVSDVGIVGHREDGSVGGRRPAGCVWYNHMPAAEIRLQLGEDVWASYFKFCVVRNPYQKCISAFEHLGAKHVAAWSRRVMAATIWGMSAEQVRFYDFLCRRKVIDRGMYTLDGEICVDAVIRHETLLADLMKICERLSVPYEPDRLPRYKAGQRRPTATVEALYTRPAQTLVARRYAFEIDTFGYRFPANEAAALRAA